MMRVVVVTGSSVVWLLLVPCLGRQVFFGEGPPSCRTTKPSGMILRFVRRRRCSSYGRYRQCQDPVGRFGRSGGGCGGGTHWICIIRIRHRFFDMVVVVVQCRCCE